MRETANIPVPPTSEEPEGHRGLIHRVPHEQPAEPTLQATALGHCYSSNPTTQRQGWLTTCLLEIVLCPRSQFTLLEQAGASKLIYFLLACEHKLEVDQEDLGRILTSLFNKKELHAKAEDQQGQRNL